MDDCFYLVFNAWHEDIEFTLPSSEYAQAWTVVVDTAEFGPVEPNESQAGDVLTVKGRAMVVLRSIS